MEYELIQEKYHCNGLSNLKVKTVEDLKKVHNIDVNSIVGIKKLSEATRNMFIEFLVNFFNSWGLESRNTIKPISAKIVSLPCDGRFLKFEYNQNGRKGWLHVKSPSVWY